MPPGILSVSPEMRSVPLAHSINVHLPSQHKQEYDGDMTNTDVEDLVERWMQELSDEDVGGTASELDDLGEGGRHRKQQMHLQSQTEASPITMINQAGQEQEIFAPPPNPESMNIALSAQSPLLMDCIDGTRNPQGQKVEQLRKQHEDKIKQDMKELLHAQKKCKPCAFYYQKEDSCRLGMDCKFCHICPADEIKKRHKAKVRAHRLRAVRAFWANYNKTLHYF